MFRPSWSGWRATRQAYGEHRPFARFARHGHVAAHHAGELAREAKAEPRSAVAPRGQGIGLGEFLKKFRLLFGGQADVRRIPFADQLVRLVHAEVVLVAVEALVVLLRPARVRVLLSILGGLLLPSFRRLAGLVLPL